MPAAGRPGRGVDGGRCRRGRRQRALGCRAGAATGSAASVVGAGDRSSQAAPPTTITTDTAPTASRPTPNHRNHPMTASTALRGGCGRGGNSGVVGIELLPGRCAGAHGSTCGGSRNGERYRPRADFPSACHHPGRVRCPAAAHRASPAVPASAPLLASPSRYRRLLARRPWIHWIVVARRSPSPPGPSCSSATTGSNAGTSGLGRHPPGARGRPRRRPGRTARRVGTSRSRPRWCRHGDRTVERHWRLGRLDSHRTPARRGGRDRHRVRRRRGRRPAPVAAGRLARGADRRVTARPAPADGDRVQLASDGVVVAGDAVVVGSHGRRHARSGCRPTIAADDPAGGRVRHAGGAPTAVSGRPPVLSASGVARMASTTTPAAMR